MIMTREDRAAQATYPPHREYLGDTDEWRAECIETGTSNGRFVFILRDYDRDFELQGRVGGTW